MENDNTAKFKRQLQEGFEDSSIEFLRQEKGETPVSLLTALYSLFATQGGRQDKRGRRGEGNRDLRLCPPILQLR